MLECSVCFLSIVFFQCWSLPALWINSYACTVLLAHTHALISTHPPTHTNSSLHTLVLQVSASVLHLLLLSELIFLLSNFLLTVWTFCCMTLFLSVFSVSSLCDWLLMVRMRPCAEGAQAPHWLPLCSCYCCHCSCAVSGQSHTARSFSFINIMSLSFTLFTSVFFCFAPLLHIFLHYFSTLIFLTSHSFLCSLTVCLHLPPNLPPRCLSISRQHFLHLTWRWTSSRALCISPHLSSSVSGNRLQRLSLLTSDYWCSQTRAKTGRSLLICIETLARPVSWSSTFFSPLQKQIKARHSFPCTAPDAKHAESESVPFGLVKPIGSHFCSQV